jgi:hypothetical protein
VQFNLRTIGVKNGSFADCKNYTFLYVVLYATGANRMEFAAKAVMILDVC